MAAQEQACGIYSFALVETAALVPHEEVDQERLLLLVKQIARDGALFSPVMVDRSSMVILDGHHRVNALKLLGCILTPVYLVDYGIRPSK
jgi:ParB-like chromosome segregation protein Spo0J